MNEKQPQCGDVCPGNDRIRCQLAPDHPGSHRHESQGGYIHTGGTRRKIVRESSSYTWSRA